MISNRCARKSLVTNCNSIISKNYLRFLVDSNDLKLLLTTTYKTVVNSRKANRFIIQKETALPTATLPFLKRIQRLCNCFSVIKSHPSK